MTYPAAESHRNQPSPPLHNSTSSSHQYWDTTMQSSDPYFASNPSYQSYYPPPPPHMDSKPPMNSDEWRSSSSLHRPHVPRRLSGVSDGGPPPDGSRFGAPPYTLPALTPDLNNSPRFSGRGYPGPAGSYASSGPSLPPPSYNRNYSLPSLADPSPALSYRGLPSHGSEGEDSSRSNSPTDSAYPPAAYPQGGPSPPSENVRRPHVASSAIRDASVARRSRDARFFCDVAGCGSNFTTKSNLQGHMRSHLNERPYACQVGCGKAFTRQSDRHRHEAKVHPEVALPRSGRRRRASSLLEHNKRLRSFSTGSQTNTAPPTNVLATARYSMSETSYPPPTWFTPGVGVAF